MSERSTCTVCQGPRVVSFLRIESAPISCNHLCLTRSDALNEPKASIVLAFCADCGHIFNTEYDSAKLKYRPGYENSLRLSERFGEYDEALTNALVDRYHLRGRVIIELGCGRGEFLRTLCERGGNSGVGFDPSYSSEENDGNGFSGVVIHPETYGAQSTDTNADFICSRHMLEHVGDPRGFLSNVRSATKRLGVPVFFEVPNGLYSLRDGGIWDIIYEHCSYFTPTSLRRLFCETGYKPVELAETFGGQFLTIHAITDAPNPETAPAPAPDLELLVKSFAQTYQSRLTDWTRRLLKRKNQGRKVVVWGAGAKGVTFLNLLRPAAVEYVVDKNPRKHGKYVVGSGQEIVPPEFLCEYKADEIICMNPNYLEEISSQSRTFGLRAQLVCA